MEDLGLWELLCIGSIVVPFILWIVALVDIVRSSFQESTNKIVWVLLVTFVPLIGAILYFIIGTSQKATRPASRETADPVSSSSSASAEHVEGSSQVSPTAQTRLCPECNIPMDIRTADQGKYRGKRFYVCPNYKECHRVFPLDR